MSITPSTVTRNGQIKRVKNLGWLLAHWRDVDRFTVFPGYNASEDCVLVAHLKNHPDEYRTGYASADLLHTFFLPRSIFYGLKVTWHDALARDLQIVLTVEVDGDPVDTSPHFFATLTRRGWFNVWQDNYSGVFSRLIRQAGNLTRQHVRYLPRTLGNPEAEAGPMPELNPLARFPLLNPTAWVYPDPNPRGYIRTPEVPPVVSTIFFPDLP